MNLNQITRREKLVLLIPAYASNGLFYFPNNATIRADQTREVLTYQLRGFCQPQIDSATPEDKPYPFDRTMVKKVDITLFAQGDYLIRRMPFTEIMQIRDHNTAYVANEIPETFSPKLIDWAKSYVELNGFAPGDFGPNGRTLIFGVSYRYMQPGTLAAMHTAGADEVKRFINQ